MGQALPGYGDVDVIVRTIRREFDEMPGLTLTADQARRLWALETPVCLAVLSRLVDAGYLCQTGSGQYVRPSTA